MTTFIQNSRQTVVDNSCFDLQASIPRFGSMTNIQDHDDDRTFRIMEIRETKCAAESSLGRLALPEDGVDDLTQGLESLSLFGRTKEQVVLDPSLQISSTVRFEKSAYFSDGEVVPVVTLDDIKGSKVITVPSYDHQDSFSPGDPDPTIPFGSLQDPLPYDVGVMNDLSLVYTNPDILPEVSEGTTEFEDLQNFVTQFANFSHSTTDTFSAFDNQVFPSDIGSPLRSSSELKDNNKPPRDLPTLHLTLEGIHTNPTSTNAPLFPLLHTDARNEQVAAPEGTTNPLLPQAFLDSSNNVLSGSSPRYPFEQTPARANLPFPLEPSTQSFHDLEAVFEQTFGNPPTDPESQSYNQHDSSFSSSDWSNPPSLSPSYTDSSYSLDSTLYTPNSSQSPLSLSLVSPQSLAAAISPQPLPTQDVLANISCVDPVLLSLDQVYFEPFPEFAVSEDNMRHRTTQRAAQVHELIMVQVAPYPIGPPAPKRKTSPSSNNKDKGKAKAKSDGDDGDSDGAHGKEHKKKKKRDETEKVRCEIGGCNGTFFSNWELKRHQKNLHGIGEETQSAAVCPKCGRHFASRRKDSVDRHLELNACGKRNPRKSPKRFTTEQTP